MNQKKSKSLKSSKNYQLGGYLAGRQSQGGSGLYGDVGITTTGFIPTYAGAPIDEFRETSRDLRDQYNQNLADATQMDILNAERRSIEGDQGLNQEIAAEYQKELDAIAQSGDYENMQNRVNALGRKYARDKRVQAVGDTYKAFEQEEEMARNMRAKGLTPLFGGDRKGYQSVVTDPETGEVSYKPYTSSMAQQLDYDKRRADIWGAVNADRYITGLSESEKALLGPSLDLFIATGSTEGITNKKIAGLVDNVMNSYMTTNEGQQELRKYMESGASQEEALRDIREHVMDRGELRQFTKRNMSIQQDPLAVAQMKAAMENSVTGTREGTFSTPAGPNQFSKLENEFDAEGNLSTPKFTMKNAETGEIMGEEEALRILAKHGIPKQPGVTAVAQLTEAEMARRDEYSRSPLPGTSNTPLTWNTGFTLQVSEEATEEAAQQLLAPFYEQFESDPEAFGMTGEQWKFMSEDEKRAKAAEVYNSMRTNTANVTSDYWGFGKEEVKGEGQISNLFGKVGVTSGSSSSLIVPQELGGGSFDDLGGWNSMQDQIREIIGEQDGQKASQDLTFSAVNKGRSKGNVGGIAGANVITISAKTKNGNVYHFDMLAEPAKEIQQIYAPLQSMFEEVASGEIGSHGPQNFPLGGSYEVIVVPQQQGEGNYQPAGVLSLDPEAFQSLVKAGVDPGAFKQKDGKTYMQLDRFQQLWYELYGRPTEQMYGNIERDKKK